MSSQLTEFKVVGLHGAVTMDVRIEDNRLVLVGENGAGKSTFVNLIYFFLTKQWSRLRDFSFAEIHAFFGERELVLTPDHLVQHMEIRRNINTLMRLSRQSSRRVSPAILDRLLVRSYGAGTEDNEFVDALASELGIPPRMVRSMLEDFDSKAKQKPTHVQTLEKHISEFVQGQFLYLPTYRRIEQDLRSIFRGVDIESELRRFRERLEKRSGAPFIELVEFGMEDVEQTIVKRMAQIKENVRNGLDNLTGTYLRDVIRGVHTTVDFHNIEGVDSKALDAIFARIDEKTLPTPDKERLKEKVETISATRAIGEADKVIAHFLSKLIELYKEQQESERNVRQFVALCNNYLSGKKLIYDNIKYTIIVTRDDDAPGSAPLGMKVLSSGEKQIVSLFAHIYLSGEQRFFVIIDEPELSLSVPWQRRFLPDILGTNMCSGLIAVTHSPFVWENDLEPYVRPLAEFTAPFHPH